MVGRPISSSITCKNNISIHFQTTFGFDFSLKFEQMPLTKISVIYIKLSLIERLINIGICSMWYLTMYLNIIYISFNIHDSFLMLCLKY